MISSQNKIPTIDSNKSIWKALGLYFKKFLMYVQPYVTRLLPHPFPNLKSFSFIKPVKKFGSMVAFLIWILCNV